MQEQSGPKGRTENTVTCERVEHAAAGLQPNSLTKRLGRQMPRQYTHALHCYLVRLRDQPTEYR